MKSYGGRRALAGVDLDVDAGETVAVLGPNGAGKTTLLRTFATLLRPDSGELAVAGHPLPAHAHAARGRIGYLGHDPLVYLDLTALQNLTLFADLYGVPDSRARIESVLDRVGLLARAFEPVRGFSRGMAQRLGIARTLLHDPALLLLDEPTAGLDATGSALLEAIVAEASTAVVVTHDVERALALADRLVVMRQGRIVRDVATAGLDADAFRAHYAQEVAV